MLRVFAQAARAAPARVPRGLVCSARTYFSGEHLTRDDEFRASGAELKNRILDSAISEGAKKFGISDRSVDFALSQQGPSAANMGNVLFEGSKQDELLSHYMTKARLSIQECLETPEFVQSTQLSEKLRILIEKRLAYNVETLSDGGVYHFQHNKSVQTKLRDILTQLTQPSRLLTSLHELGELSDDLVYYAGDESYEFDWYEARARTALLYVKCELYMLSDMSEDFVSTKKYLAQQLLIQDRLKDGVTGAAEYLQFSGFALANLIKSQLSRG